MFPEAPNPVAGAIRRILLIRREKHNDVRVEQGQFPITRRIGT